MNRVIIDQKKLTKSRDMQDINKWSSLVSLAFQKERGKSVYLENYLKK